MIVSTPKPDAIVPYVAYSSSNHCDAETPQNGKLCIFGDPGSSKMALLCAGFPDDQTIFYPFAKALSEGKTNGENKQTGDGNSGILVGVMCIPGYDDRPEDGAPWQSHPEGGFSFDETAHAVREASKALNDVSTYHDRDRDRDCDRDRDRPEFIGIFHDWGVVSGTMWAQRLEQEARDAASASTSAAASNGLLKPDKIVFFDVLIDPPSSMPGFLPAATVQWRDFYKGLFVLYQIFYAVCFTIRFYVSKQLATAFFVASNALLQVTGISPVYDVDFESIKAVYGDRPVGLLRMVYMTFMYRNIFTTVWSGKVADVFRLHEDWKAMPLLFLYGKKKRAAFHSDNMLAMLEREEAEKRSLSRAVGVEEAGHWLYVQKQDECLNHVLEFINAENTFLS